MPESESEDERRIAADGNAYTMEEFQNWYGSAYPTIWNQSHPTAGHLEIPRQETLRAVVDRIAPLAENVFQLWGKKYRNILIPHGMYQNMYLHQVTHPPYLIWVGVRPY